MTTLIGLGNPGTKYSKTKHNFGFWIMDRFAQKNNLSFQAGKGDYLIAKCDDLICVKPTTFMNSSGLAVADYCRYFQVSYEDLLIIYDDIDLPLGVIRFRPDGGSGGHLGIESIIYQIKSEDFCRLRMGIAINDLNEPAEKYVLSPFHADYEKIKDIMIEKACDGIEYFVSHTVDETMNEFNKQYE
mgnify:CR=1 FL=1